MDKIGYIEFRGGDLGATKGFYGNAFGMAFTDYGPQYAAFGKEAGIDGGFNAHEGAHDTPLVLFQTTDLEAALGRVESAGGTITQAIFAYPGGRRFHFRDPSGNELGVFIAED